MASSRLSALVPDDDSSCDSFWEFDVRDVLREDSISSAVSASSSPESSSHTSDSSGSSGEFFRYYIDIYGKPVFNASLVQAVSRGLIDCLRSACMVMPSLHNLALVLALLESSLLLAQSSTVSQKA
jgi:hypothetical protein